MNVYALFANAVATSGSRIAVSCGQRRQTYRELDAAAAAFAAYLEVRGLRRGDRVALFLKNGFEFPAILLGVFRAGLVASPINFKLHPREAGYIVEHCEAAAIVVDAGLASKLSAFLPEQYAQRLIVVGAPDHPASLEHAISNASSTAFDPAEVAPEEPAWLFYTSGTTGRPKGAVLTHRNLIAMSVNCLADIYSFRPDDRVLHAAPLSHGSGMYLLPALSRGAQNIIDAENSFDPDRILRLVAELSVTVFAFLAPTMIVRLLSADTGIATPSLRVLIYGGAPMHREHLRTALRRFGPILVQLYGQGESPMTISYLPAWAHDADDDEALSSAGFVRSGVDVRLLDGEGGKVGAGEIGEISVQGDVVMPGYWRNEAANEAAITRGFRRTGDLGRFDAKGRLHLMERRHDMIISGGSNIYPREVEEALTQHPGVKEAIVFGVPDPEWGESVMAAVVMKPGAAPVTEQALIEYCRERLASFKKPRHVQFLEEMPTNAYGKVLRRELRQKLG